MSNLRKDPCHVGTIFCFMSIRFMSHVGVKKLLCRPVEFNGPEPQSKDMQIMTNNQMGVSVLSNAGYSVYMVNIMILFFS